MAIHPVSARKRIADFLLIETDIPNKLIRNLAFKELQKIKQCSNDNKPITDKELKAYIKEHYQSLRSNSEKIISDIAQELFPNSVFMYLLKQFSFITFFLLPPLYVCVDYTIASFKDGFDLTKAGTEIASTILIIVLLISSAIASIFNKAK